MIKQAIYTFNGVNQDVSKSKHPVQYYYEAGHINIIATDSQSTGSVTNEKGNEIILQIPDITINTSLNTISYNSEVINYTNNNEIDIQISNNILPVNSNSQKIIGHTNTRDSIILLTTDDNGMDCIWEVENILSDNITLKLLHIKNLGFSINNPIQVIYNYENENIQKIYWVDGKQQIKFCNIKDEDLINSSSNGFSFVGNISFSQPKIVDKTSGGIHTSGMIQYAYNLYRLNSSQTKISPLSELTSLDKGVNLGGGEVNEVVGTIPVVEINDIDTTYTHIKVYAIKYTSYNQIPSISLIDERELSTDSITIYDSGNIISTLSLEEFIFLGSDPIVPKHIESKDSRLFLSNIQTRDFDLELDCRAYSFPISGNTTKIYNSNELGGSGPIASGLTVSNTSFNVPEKHDAINGNYDLYKYQSGGSVLGGEGKYIEYELVQKNLTNPENYKLFKDNEIYRIGIQFFNRLGQKSLPKWIADFKSPEGNLEGNKYNTLSVTLKPDFYTWLNDDSNFESEDDKPVGYKIIRAERTNSDKTILCQGITSGMMVNIPRDSEGDALFSTIEKRQKSDTNFKMPNFLMRTFEEIEPLQFNSHLLNMQFRNSNPSDTGNTGTTNELTEIQYDGSERVADTFQYTVMNQLYSPEILFDQVSLSSGLKYKLKGGALNTQNSTWVQERNVETKVADRETKVNNELTPHATGASVTAINGSSNDILDRGLISNTNANDNETHTDQVQWYRQFNNYKKATNQLEYDVYGTPELTERGAGRKFYNNNPKYEYSNSLEGLLTDGADAFDDDQEGLISLNSWGSKCITSVLGISSDTQSYHRPTLEYIYASSAINDTSSSLLFEIVRPSNVLYSGNIYKGNSFEDKKRTTYIEIGDYKDINDSSVQIDNPGDTFVQNFKFIRISKTDTEIYQYNINQITELVEFKVETTIDLKNRNDISLSNWDGRFQPRYDEYHKYNRVYSQQSNLIRTQDVDFTFQKVKNFDTRIQSTKLKIPNETIDSWTDILPNEVMDLDGAYGPINNIINYKDNIFAFQDEGIANISINPRVQVQASDGIGLELGTGRILYDYNYLTDKSGSINKWGMISTKSGIYYYDALNKAIGRVPDLTNKFLTDIKGLHTFFNNNYNYSLIKEDNPYLQKGVVFGYDNYNNDVFFTLHQDNKSFTWRFDEEINEFVDLKTYKPLSYINKGEKLLLLHPDNNKLYQNYIGEYNKFFDEYQPSYITLQLNPESNLDCVFNNIFYKSELYLNDIDQPDKTLTHLQLYNEYQDSGRIPLILGRNNNLRRKFRKWQVNLPRNASSRERIRNPWVFLKLELDNSNNYKLILHDIIISYNI